MSHTLSMEQKMENVKGVTLSQKEAEEYCAYKRQKKIAEIMSAMHRLESLFPIGEGNAKICDQAARLKQSAIRMTPIDVEQYGKSFKKGAVKLDCLLGGNGETVTKVKAYEGKRAIRDGAGELTLLLSHTLIAGSRYNELRKELRRMRRVAKGIPLKARIERAYPQATLSRLARLCSETGMQYFSLPYFSGCERLQTELVGGCRLEVSGIETLADFKKMIGAGIGRIVTSHAWEIYSEWIKEVEKIVVETREAVTKTEEPKLFSSPAPMKSTELKAEKQPLPLPLPQATHSQP